MAKSPFHKRSTDVEPMGDWRDHAACAEIGFDIFFPEAGESPHDAKRVCVNECTVRAECLEWALSQSHQMYGVWGGTTENERRELRRQRARQAKVCGTLGGYAEHYRRGEKPCDDCRDAKREYRKRGAA